MIGCQEATRRLWEYLDRTADPVDRAELEQHLARCRRCCGELEFAVELRRVLAGARHDTLPEDVRQRLTEILEDLGP
jgi:mycothiol system anti-sigma-R factor